MGPRAFCSIWSIKQIVKYLWTQTHKCQDSDSKPHSAYQKHQSLSPVLFTARPEHAPKISRLSLSWLPTFVISLLCPIHLCINLPSFQRYNTMLWQNKNIREIFNFVQVSLNYLSHQTKFEVEKKLLKFCVVKGKIGSVLVEKLSKKTKNKNKDEFIFKAKSAHLSSPHHFLH